MCLKIVANKHRNSKYGDGDIGYEQKSSVAQKETEIYRMKETQTHTIHSENVALPHNEFQKWLLFFLFYQLSHTNIHNNLLCLSLPLFSRLLCLPFYESFARSVFLAR